MRRQGEVPVGPTNVTGILRLVREFTAVLSSQAPDMEDAAKLLVRPRTDLAGNLEGEPGQPGVKRTYVIRRQGTNEPSSVWLELDEPLPIADLATEDALARRVPGRRGGKAVHFSIRGTDRAFGATVIAEVEDAIDEPDGPGRASTIIIRRDWLLPPVSPGEGER